MFKSEALQQVAITLCYVLQANLIQCLWLNSPWDHNSAMTSYG